MRGEGGVRAEDDEERDRNERNRESNEEFEKEKSGGG